jgi:riboflavin biosynthesis pyrimidine reductase
MLSKNYNSMEDSPVIKWNNSTVRITNVMAASLDGVIASHPNESDDERKAMGFTNEVDHDHVRRLLTESDAVIVGAHSVNVSGGVMEVMNDKGKFPTWIMCTRTGFAHKAPIWNHPSTPKWLVSDKDLPVDKMTGAEQTLVYNPLTDGDNGMVHAIVDACAKAGLKRVLLFGGGVINAKFYEAGAINEFIVTICPVIVGSDQGVPIVQPSLSIPTHFKLEGVKTDGNLVFIHYIATS